MITKHQFKSALKELGVKEGMTLEVHCSLSSFGELEGGAMTVIDTLKELVTDSGSIFMPALMLSRELELSGEDRKLGITVKIKILDPDAEKTAMGIVADTFRGLPDTVTGRDTISTSGWGRHADEVLTGGLDYAIQNGGKALMLGVDIYKLTAMHYVEGCTPEDISDRFAPSDEARLKYPPDKWLIECGCPPEKAWYKIQDEAFEKGLIKETYIGSSRVMFFDIHDVVSIYERKLREDPYRLWGIEKSTAHRITDLTEPDHGCEGFAPGEEPTVTLTLDDGRRVEVYDRLAYEKGWDTGAFISDEEIEKYAKVL